MSVREERARNREARRQTQVEEEQRLQRVEGRKARSRTLHYAVTARELTGSRVSLSGSTMTRNMFGEFVVTHTSSRRTWGAVFSIFLHTILGDKPYWRDLRIQDDTHKHEQSVVIESSHERHNDNAGNTKGKLYIVMRYNHPQVAVSSDPHPSRVDDWSAMCRTVRQCRIELRPVDEFRRFLRVLPLTQQELANNHARTQRVEGFLSWSHGVYRRASPYHHWAVYHDDYNTSEPPVRIVAKVIDEHYRLAAGGEDFADV